MLFRRSFRNYLVRIWHSQFGHPEEQRLGRRGSSWSGHVWLCQCGIDYMMRAG